METYRKCINHSCKQIYPHTINPNSIHVNVLFITNTRQINKLRIVHDASLHVKSLNDVFYRSPVIIPHLTGLLD